MAGLHVIRPTVDAFRRLLLLPHVPARVRGDKRVRQLHGLHDVPLCQLGSLRILLPVHSGGLVPGRHGHCRHKDVRLQCRLLLPRDVHHVRLLQLPHKPLPHWLILPGPGQRPHSLPSGNLGRCHRAHHGLLLRPVRAGLFLPGGRHHCHAESVPCGQVWQHGWPWHLCLLWTVSDWLLVRSWQHLQHPECLSSRLIWQRAGAHRQRLQRRVLKRLLLPLCIHQLAAICMPAWFLWRSDGLVLAILQRVLQSRPLLPSCQHLPHAGALPCGSVWRLWGAGD